MCLWPFVSQSKSKNMKKYDYIMKCKCDKYWYAQNDEDDEPRGSGKER